MRRRALADARGVPRSTRRDQPDPRPELDRAGDPHRPIGAAGWPGLLVGGRAASSCRRLLIVGAVAWAYVRFGTLPAGRGRLLRRQAGGHRDHRPGALAAGAHRGQVGWSRRSRRWARSRALLAGVHELVVLLAAGLVSLAVGGRGLVRAEAPWSSSLSALPGVGRRPRRRRRPALVQRCVRSGPCSCLRSRSARCSSAAATCCSRFCAPTWSSGSAGSPSGSCSTPSRSGR